MSSQAEPHAVLTRIYEALNRHDLDGFIAPFAEDYVDHGDSPPSVGRAGMKQHLAAFLTAFPDLHTTLDHVIVEGEWYASRTTTTGTHRAELMGMAATGRTIRVPGVDLGRVRDGLVTERWGGLDTFALLQQLGALPAPAQTSA